MKDKLLQIIEHYGVSHQQRKLEEEIFEFQESIFEYRKANFNNFEYGLSKKEYRKYIIEELADCFVLLNQFKEYYGITDDEIQKIMEYKIDRQIERIEKENK